MKYVKTPMHCARSGQDVYLMEADDMPLCRLYMLGTDGDAIGHDLTVAVNAHDDLIAQRDALVAALEGIRAVMDHLYTCADCSTWGLCEDVNVLIARAKHLQQGIYAPELVRGEDERG